jgi:hypothetical protein
MGGIVGVMACAQLRASEVAWAADSLAMSIGTPAVVSRCISERLAQEGAALTVVNNRDWCPRLSVVGFDELLDDLST